MSSQTTLPGRNRTGAGTEGDRSYGLALLRVVRRAIVFVLGLSVVLVGIVMMVMPGPAFIVIPLGLAILATEFLWARRILEALKRRVLGNDAPPPKTRLGIASRRLTNLGWSCTRFAAGVAWRLGETALRFCSRFRSPPDRRGSTYSLRSTGSRRE